MRRNILTNSLAAILLITGISCAKKIVTPPASGQVVKKSVTGTKAETINAINASQLVFETFSVRAKADLAIGNNKNDVTMHIRIKKDQAIWVSITAIAGIEVARALITPDSIKILNRIESIYVKKPFSYVHEFTNKQINFKTLQSLLTGNAISELVTEKADIVSTPVLQLNGTLEKLTYSMLFTDHKKVSQVRISDAAAGQDLKVNYGDYAIVSGKEVPQMISIRSLAAKKQIAVDLVYNKIDIDTPIDMPFSVSKRFTIKN
ncbi:MAG TPA: DUF4292 domain-containing protein [Sphingobacteriaceae bacterium]|nr:DUF4292 domain-containing protein [Sphingobacteriaceae bacterium]